MDNPQQALQFLNTVRRQISLPGETHDLFLLALRILAEAVQPANPPPQPPSEK